LADTPHPTMQTQHSPKAEALRKGQMVTIALLLLGYAGYYLCRVHLSITTPLLIAEFHNQGVNKASLGTMIAWGLAFYAAGKFINGSLADYLGGRTLFLIGMAGAIACTVLFGLSGALPLFTLAWVANRGIQSAGWTGLTKITSRWFPYSSYGTAMGLISLSYLFGDFLSRLFLGTLIRKDGLNLGWRSVFFIAAAVLGVIFVVTLFLLKESPQDVGAEEPHASPDNVYGKKGDHAAKENIFALLRPLLVNPTFWVVCALSFGFTMLRETFNDWIPTYLHEVVKMEEGAAGQASSLFPLFGGLSVLLAGFISDRLGRMGRAVIIFGGLILTTPAIFALAHVDFHGSHTLPVVVLGGIAFVMLGPYSFLAGAIGLDFGGKRGGATACGWIDGIGYIGGMLAGQAIGGIAEHQGWSAAFVTLTVVAGLTCVAAAVYLFLQSRPLRDVIWLESAAEPNASATGKEIEIGPEL
jgi:OPA family glycerol-3-phosphate transporter-like MFS transporter